MKGVIATDVIFIVVVIGLIIVASLIVFWKWLDLQNMQANQWNCRMKLMNYCSDLIRGRQTNWDDISPKEGCEKYVAKPSLEDCKKVY
jgi:hypothetical protein